MKEQPTNFNANSANAETKPKKHGRYFWLKVIAGLIILLAILYFVSEELFAQVLGAILAVIVITLPIVSLVYPFKFFKKKYSGFTKKGILLSILTSALSTALVLIGLYYFFLWSISFIAQEVSKTF